MTATDDSRVAQEQAARLEATLLALADTLSLTGFGAGSFAWGTIVAAAKVMALNWNTDQADDLLVAFDNMIRTVRGQMLQTFLERDKTEGVG